MAPHPRRPDAAELGYRTWNSLRGRAGDLPGEFTPQTRGDVRGWLWEGALAALIREVVPGIADGDLRRVREYLNASGMVVNAHGQQRGGGQPQWFIRSAWHEGRGGHVHVVTTPRASQPAAPAASQPAAAASQAAPPGESPEQGPEPRRELAPALRSLLEQVSELESDNDRLRAGNARLTAEIERLRSLVRQAGEKIIQQATELMDSMPERPG